MTTPTIYKQLTSLIFGACVMSMLASCSKSSSGGGVNFKKDPLRQEPEELGITGRYIAKFHSLNSSVAGVTAAEAKIQVMGDQITVSLAVKDSPASTVHSQFIYAASECPTEVHDTNSDGFIDPVEASKVLGKILIPLDAELNSQEEGSQDFPQSNFLGTYSYYKEGVLSSLITDLQSPDDNDKDEVGKISINEQLKLEGRVIVIQGIANDVYLPGSVRTFDGLSDRATLSIACGKIARVMNIESETATPEGE